VARALQAEEGDPSEIALHLVGAGDHNAATGALEKAARERLERYANEEAERLAEAGLRLNPTPAQAPSLLETRAEARARRGDSQGARADFRTIVARRASGPGRAAALIRIAELTSGSEDYEHASEVIELALSEAGEDKRVRARALVVAALLDLNLNRTDRAHLRSEEALRTFEQLGDALGAATILDLRAMSAFASGQFREAVRLFDRVIPLFTDTGALVRLYTPLSLRGLCCAFLDEPERALADVDAGERTLLTLGKREDRPASEWTRSEILTAAGQIQEGLAHAEKAFDLATRLGHREWTSAALLGIGGVRLATREWRKAETALRRCLKTAIHLPAFSSWASARLALALIGQGRESEAEPLLTHAFEGPGLAHYEARLARTKLLTEAGDPALTAYAAEATELAETGGHLVSARALRALVQGD
jgi:tetratricopeptide (TPR) repeat protein